ncbi:MAG: bifunctional diaminohydroxyphosphoribosylaminopyrimidine deaminase/5-amino-6-(5-phosphoribosylamino)uracil reductase RibD [Campylobacteraceae bacterium]|jgi:diaminohydroxyphosphoribosylaminopyrimidine deaminase/5-amino-6-(5-phosphoribosylamino)uracil reductase|nr:bifunctional diaminohydroxyphosphoribosylaminopyrimidine deaminase/5-amino-6-(5-phosphoribosylamino)uracil reductase RibD [Campylobacteraceae bacterium]
MVIDDRFYLSLAINEAWKYQGLTYPNPAVGCVITDKNGAILVVAAHKRRGLPHAELEATYEALSKLNPLLEFPQDPNELHAFISKHHNNLLKNSTFYVTLEPCAHQGLTPPCATLIATLGAKRVVIGSSDKTQKAKGGADILRSAGIAVEEGVLKQECDELLKPFLLWQSGSFSFFKLALRLDGTYDNGTITSHESRVFVHKLRSVCDLIVIGGKTLRTDNPLLDARLVGGKAPDALICTAKDVDKNANVFSVKDREMIVQNSLDFPKKYKNIMIEGGSSFLRAMSDKADRFLIFHSADFSERGRERIEIDLRLKLLYQGSIGADSFGWYYKERFII